MMKQYLQLPLDRSGGYGGRFLTYCFRPRRCYSSICLTSSRSPASPYSNVNSSSNSNNSNSSNNGSNGIQKRHISTTEKLANLGSLITELKSHTPHLLQSAYPRHLLAPDIVLRLFPITHPGIPTIRGGILGYMAAVRMLQMLVTSAVISHDAKLKVLGEHLVRDECGKSQSDGEREIMVPTKYVLKWCTCSPELYDSSTSIKDSEMKAAKTTEGKDDDSKSNDASSPAATLKSTSLFEHLPPILNSSAYQDLFTHSPHENYPHDDKLQPLQFLDSASTDKNVLFGIFEFEFTENCDQVLVHTIQNVEVLNDGQEERSGTMFGDSTVPL